MQDQRVIGDADDVSVRRQGRAKDDSGAAASGFGVRSARIKWLRGDPARDWI
jgi:hypothetical protein